MKFFANSALLIALPTELEEDLEVLNKLAEFVEEATNGENLLPVDDFLTALYEDANNILLIHGGAFRCHRSPHAPSQNEITKEKFLELAHKSILTDIHHYK